MQSPSTPSATKTQTRVAILGGYGTFHEIAALNYFHPEAVEILPSTNFKELFGALDTNKADYGITAIENSVAGSIIPNYQLLTDYDLPVIGEIYLRIYQNLAALPGQRIEDLHTVYSHPMALLQCKRFFDEYPHIQLIDSPDTASSAREIQKKQTLGVGAICSMQAAENNQLEILGKSIESNKKNYTRFLILRDRHAAHHENPASDKASIYFSLAHEIGSLSKILSIFSYFEINLSKIQSLPIIGKEWEYLFHADLEYQNYARYRQSLESVQPFVGDFKILGEYQRGKVITE